MDSLTAFDVYLIGLGIIYFIYGVLAGIDDANADDVGVVVFVALIWPVLTLPVLGVIVGTGIKKFRSEK